MELLELGNSPISDNKPAGEDVRFEPEFEELENEIQKLSSVTNIESIDCDKVVSLSQSILEKKSKNLLVACYLSYALLKTQGISGLADGVHVLKDLLENYWDTMYPPVARMRGRKNALLWWIERIDAGIGDLKTEKWQKEKRDRFINDLTTIDTFLSEHIEDFPPLQRKNENLISLIEEEELPPQPAPAEESSKPVTPQPEITTTSPPAPAAPVQPSEEVSEVDVNKLLNQGMEILGKAAILYMKHDNFSPVPFRLNRIVAWLPIQNLPPVTDGKTLIPPPDEQIVSSLQSLYQSQNWRDLLQIAEPKVRQFLFWIDLSRYVSEALEQLRYPDISEIVAYETLDYVNRFNGIEKLSFADGTPFADGETREWLKSIAKQRLGSTGSIAAIGGSDVEQRFAKEFSEAQKMIKENKLAMALNGFREKLNQAATVRERFIWEINLCRLLLNAKKQRLVIPYIHEILEMLDTYKVEKWEPGLAVEGLTIILSSLRLQEEKKDEELIESILDRVSAINPVIALDLL